MGLTVVFSALFGQRVLVDDVPVVCHDMSVWNALWDILRSNGTTVEFTSDVGRFPDLSGYDELILMEGVLRIILMILEPR
ncbi:MAG TPA: hypothetical protein ENG11_02015 [candidate division Zixibacteria bacterium]|nr:hypothetical protein [candidate division Zixibacteria bacterium]